MGLIIGTILSVGFDAGTLPVRGFLQCNGSAVDRTIYAELFNVIGTRWGTGDGTRTFNLPDLRGVFVKGSSNDDQVGNIEFYTTPLSSTEKLSASVKVKRHHPLPHLAINSPWYQTAGPYYTASNNNNGLHIHKVAAKDDYESRSAVNVYVDYVIYTGVVI